MLEETFQQISPVQSIQDRRFDASSILHQRRPADKFDSKKATPIKKIRHSLGARFTLVYNH